MDNKNEYPPIKVKEKNLYYGRLLLYDYAGAVSELTAWSQYFNHGAVIFQEYKEVADILYHIGKVEMTHLQILGQLIELLGINPKYRIIKENNLRIWWSPCYINYEIEVFEILQANMESEKNAIKQYTNHLNIIKDDYIKAILTKIILEEKEHLKILEYAYTNLKENKPIKFSKDNLNKRPNENIIPPSREFTLEELNNYYNGADGRPAYVAINNMVFDVSDVASWAGGTHFGLYAGEIHTDVFDKHHNGNIQFLKERVPMVGYLKEI